MANKIYRYDVTISVDVTAESEEEAERLRQKLRRLTEM